MKRLLLVLVAALACAVLGAAPVSASLWPFGHHSKAKAAKSEDQPVHKEKTHHSFSFRRHHEEAQHAPASSLYTTGGPKSVGFWHKQPGPAGAGS